MIDDKLKATVKVDSNYTAELASFFDVSVKIILDLLRHKS